MTSNAVDLAATTLTGVGEAPEWFQRACSTPTESRFIQVKGAPIETRAWGRRGAPGLLLIHGFAANASWWDFVAPLLADDFRLAALSFSGMGRSGWREDGYQVDDYVDEALACAEAAGLFDAGPITIVAHSFGTGPGVRLAQKLGARARAFLPLDRPLVQWNRAGFSDGPLKIPHFASQAVARQRFRMKPGTMGKHPYIEEYIFQSMLKPVESGGWTWRTDPMLRDKLAGREDDMEPRLNALTCPVVFVRGAMSDLFPPGEIPTVETRWPVITVPEAGHHIWVDEPLATVATLEAILKMLPGSRP